MSQDQKILFQVSYVNYAWGGANEGFIIDNEGNILTYSNPDVWNFPSGEKILTVAQVNENLSKCIATGKKISVNELQNHINYIDNLASSKISSPVGRGADMGSHGYYCFQYSGNNSTYKCVTIKIEGDWESENLNYCTNRVVDWLQNISKGL